MSVGAVTVPSSSLQFWQTTVCRREDLSAKSGFIRISKKSKSPGAR
jgi:hypothetical protein